MHSARDCIGPSLGREEKVGMELGKEGAGRGYFGKGGRMVQGMKKRREKGKRKEKGREGKRRG